MKPDLDIGVVVPTRNSMPHIRDHVEALNQWIGRVKEVVVVDSQSIDGTVDYIREHLLHPNLVIMDHPPGLYESWNAGISKIQSEFTYIATVNDYMPIETLEALYIEAKASRADVVISPPEIISEGALDEDYRWPIHRFLEVSSIKKGYEIRPLELLVWNSIDLPGTLIGSSASNLYRTDPLQKSPFSCDYGHAGDSAWAVGSALANRWVVVPEVLSKFWYHGGQNNSSGHGRRLRAQLYALSAGQAEYARDSLPFSDAESGILDELKLLTELWTQKEQAVLGYQAYRKRHIPWVFFPRAWVLRSSKNRSDLEIRRQVKHLLQATGDLYGYVN
jgi:hypothetical protein